MPTMPPNNKCSLKKFVRFVYKVFFLPLFILFYFYFQIQNNHKECINLLVIVILFAFFSVTHSFCDDQQPTLEFFVDELPREQSDNVTKCFLLLVHVFITALVIFSSIVYYIFKLINFVKQRRRESKMKRNCIPSDYWNVTDIEKQRQWSKLMHSISFDSSGIPPQSHLGDANI